MAEVSLTFGDCEKDLGTAYNEVTITRRVFRDGASEYELNKTAVPAARHPVDVHGHGHRPLGLLDHGAGQDRLDPVVAAGRPPRDFRRSRRHHEVYKSQKKEALRKLENTEANLDPPG